MKLAISIIAFQTDKQMTKYLIRLLKALMLTILMITTSCDKDDVLSDSNFITSFTLRSGDFTKDFEIKDGKVDGAVPYTIDNIDVAIEITISDKATITPDPSTITSITESINFVVTAENGEEKNYVVDIKRELSPENTMVSFGVKTPLFETNAAINNETGAITQRVLPGTDLTSIATIVTVSDRATIAPDPATILDYSGPVNFTVTAENGDAKEYLITLELMNKDFLEGCNEQRNFFKWFGGDDNDINPDFPEAGGPRNVGAGQTIILEKDLYPTIFGIYLSDAFSSEKDLTVYMNDVELNLDIRDENGNTIESVKTVIQPPFGGGRVDFDLSSSNLVLKAEKKYYFTWFLVDGETLGITSSSVGNTDETLSGFCGNGGYCAESRKRDDTSLKNWDIWVPWGVNFNFRLEGKQ